jgi:hypothetical protein
MERSNFDLFWGAVQNFWWEELRKPTIQHVGEVICGYDMNSASPNMHVCIVNKSTHHIFVMYK